MTISYSGNFFRLLLRWKGSIWRSVWRELLVFLVLFYVIRFTMPEFITQFDADGARGFRKKYKLLCNEFNEYTKLIPLTFLLGFYVSNVVSRWWCQFECLSWPEDVLSVLCMVLPLEESRPVRHQIARYLNLTSALAWRDISTKIRLRFPHVRNLVDAGMLTDFEYKKLKAINEPSPGIRWLTPLHWAQQLITQEVSAGRGQLQYMSTLSNEFRSYRVSFRKLYCHDWVCVPLVYTQVAALATYAHFFFCLFGRQHHEGDENLDLPFPLFTVVQFLFFVGWSGRTSCVLSDWMTTISSFLISLISEEPPSFEEDFFWRHHHEQIKQVRNGNCKIEMERISSLKWGRIDLSRTSHKHPPKLHTYLEMKGLEPEEYKNRKKNKFIAW
ncbi:unnamed protein product [Caenorhabditis auriculariae]|uniref:Bestrophin homolog n=1 Tax=Caenorhabditis auriculariae TaxID=2777116 RepID=A0A8S1HKZ1_9PELO|nr:unnamed protein product [Caenorhabditis auriculariae]